MASLDVVERVVKAARQSSNTDLVTFTPSFVEMVQVPAAGGTGVPVSVPGTGFTRRLDEPDERLDVQGTFSLARGLHPKARVRPLAGLSRRTDGVEWGYVKQSIRVRRRWAGDEAYHRLRCLNEVSGKKGSHLFLAVAPEESNAPLDALFVGPLSARDAGFIPEFVANAVNTPAVLDQAHAEGLSRSRNPWVAWLGLYRLRGLRCLAPRHFAAALRCRSAEDVEAAVGEMFSSVIPTDTERDELTAELLFVNLQPEAQRLALKAARELFEHDRRGARAAVDLRKWQEAARGYRATALCDPTRRGVVDELDMLRALPEENIVGK